MEYSVHGFSQEKAIELGLDDRDLLILGYLKSINRPNSFFIVDSDDILKNLKILKYEKDTIVKKIKKYTEIGLLIKLSSEQIVTILKNKNLKGTGIGFSTCSWCGIKTTSIQKHHYPISRADGGKELVEICPTCHYEFHLGNYYFANYQTLNSDNINASGGDYK